MKRFLLIIGLVLWSGVLQAQVATQVLPSPGKLLGFVQEDQPGGWLVFGPNFSDADSVLISADKTSVVFEGKKGTYAVIYFTMKDGIPAPVKHIVVLGGTTPDPQPDPEPDPDPKPPSGKYRIVLFYSKPLERLPRDQQTILNSVMFREWLASQGHDLLEVVDPAAFAGSVSASWKPWVDAVAGDPMPRIAIAPLNESGYVTDYPLPANVEACRALLTNPATQKAVKTP